MGGLGECLRCDGGGYVFFLPLEFRRLFVRRHKFKYESNIAVLENLQSLLATATSLSVKDLNFEIW